MSQLTDIAIFSKLRQRAWWVAPGVASIMATALDTSVFFSIALAGTEHSRWRMVIGDFCTKLVIDLCMLGPFRIAMRSLGTQAGNPRAKGSESLAEVAGVDGAVLEV